MCNVIGLWFSPSQTHFFLPHCIPGIEYNHSISGLFWLNITKVLVIKYPLN